MSERCPYFSVVQPSNMRSASGHCMACGGLLATTNGVLMHADYSEAPRTDPDLLCAFFDRADGGIVTAEIHHAGEGPLYFFWPIPGGNAVRVPVCEEHCERLKLWSEAAKSFDPAALIELLYPFALAAALADDRERPDDYDVEGLLVMDCGDLRKARELFRDLGGER